MVTLPSPRFKYYQNDDIDQIKENIFDYANDIVNTLGFFRVSTGLPLLDMVESFSLFILYIGLVGNLVVILFVITAILLIYSLLMISIERKTFEFGVMRLQGLTKKGLI